MELETLNIGKMKDKILAKISKDDMDYISGIFVEILQVRNNIAVMLTLLMVNYGSLQKFIDAQATTSPMKIFHYELTQKLGHYEF
jgi:hypothetical protein